MKAIYYGRRRDLGGDISIVPDGFTLRRTDQRQKVKAASPLQQDL